MYLFIYHCTFHVDKLIGHFCQLLIYKNKIDITLHVLYMYCTLISTCYNYSVLDITILTNL